MVDRIHHATDSLLMREEEVTASRARHHVHRILSDRLVLRHLGARQFTVATIEQAIDSRR
jgi:hypothetical protein